MFIVIIRTIILYTIVFLTFRVMGKRQIGELQPYELAITIMISALASIPMQDTDIPLINSLTPIILIFSIQIYMSAITTKSITGRRIICGKPTILIENGQIVEGELNKSRININELLEELRTKGYPDISEIEFAFIETNGSLSVIPKSQKRPVTPEDLNIATDYEGIPHPIIIDGQIHTKNLEKVGLTKEWIKQELISLGINNTSDVFFANLDSNGNLFYQVYRQKNN
ncbi:YetF domain-containing protein [Natroniella sp. ANB-PHB2]|uniref:YetF domain-containing protein n=1 Tax=Natroniella sp. ANB-PHB2 TaxID=3384444 RepID=UPI0038D47A32